MVFTILTLNIMDRPVLTNIIDPDQMPHYIGSDQSAQFNCLED